MPRRRTASPVGKSIIRPGSCNRLKRTLRKTRWLSQQDFLFLNALPYCILLDGRMSWSGPPNSLRRRPEPWASPPVEYEENGHHDAPKSRRIIPFQLLAEICHRKYREHRKRNHFLNNRQLRRREFVRADAVGRNLETVFEKRNSPA